MPSNVSIMKKLALLFLCISNFILLFGQHEQNNICFTFQDNTNEIIKPTKVEIIDNTGSIFLLDQNYCFNYVKDSIYSFVIKVEDAQFYFFERQYLAPIHFINDTIVLNRMEQKIVYLLNIQDHKNIDKEILEFKLFLKNKNFKNILLRVDLESSDLKEIKKLISNLSEIFIDNIMDKNIKNPIITICFEKTEKKFILIELSN